MNLRQDLALLRPTLLLATALLLTGLLAALFAHVRVADVRQEHRLASARLQSARARLARIEDEAGEIRAAATLFHALAARGIVGGERRPLWLEQIRHIREERRLFDLQWELQASRPLEQPGRSEDAAGVSLRASRLLLRMPLLHEEDLQRFLDDAQDQLQAYVCPRRCAIEWAASPDVPQATAPQPQLQAECELDLITLSLPGTGPASSRQP